MYYNRDLFDLSGVPYPSDNWHWEEFLETAQALESQSSVYFPFGSGGADITPFVYQNGGKLLDDAVPGEIRWDDPVAIEAIQWYVDLALAWNVMPVPQELAEYAMANDRRETIISAGSEEQKSALQAQADLELAIANGDVAMWMGSFSERGGEFRRWDFNWDYVPLPTGHQSATSASVMGYFITMHTEDVDESLVWIDFLTQQLPLYGGLPIRRSTADQEAFQDLYEPRPDSAYMCLLSLDESLVIPDFQEIFVSQQIQGPIFAVLAGDMTVDEALAILE
jgi:multiple sugar transport system substrate-binding protein